MKTVSVEPINRDTMRPQLFSIHLTVFSWLFKTLSLQTILDWIVQIQRLDSIINSTSPNNDWAIKIILIRREEKYYCKPMHRWIRIEIKSRDRVTLQDRREIKAILTLTSSIASKSWGCRQDNEGNITYCESIIDTIHLFRLYRNRHAFVNIYCPLVL